MQIDIERLQTLHRDLTTAAENVGMALEHLRKMEQADDADVATLDLFGEPDADVRAVDPIKQHIPLMVIQLAKVMSQQQVADALGMTRYSVASILKKNPTAGPVLRRGGLLMRETSRGEDTPPAELIDRGMRNTSADPAKEKRPCPSRPAQPSSAAPGSNEPPALPGSVPQPPIAQPGHPPMLIQNEHAVANDETDTQGMAKWIAKLQQDADRYQAIRSLLVEGNRSAFEQLSLVAGRMKSVQEDLADMLVDAVLRNEIDEGVHHAEAA